MRDARCGGPRTLFRTIDANLDCAFVEKERTFLRQSLIWKSQQNRIELVTRPESQQSAGKEYVAIYRLHESVERKRVEQELERLKGALFQVSTIIPSSFVL